MHARDGVHLWNLCALCRYRSWDEQGDLYCAHPLAAARNDPDYLLPGADCWGFRLSRMFEPRAVREAEEIAASRMGREP